MEYDIRTERGFEAMYHEYFPRIFNYVFYRTLSFEDTEDLVSDIFFKAARNASSYDAKKASLGTWLNTIAKNSVYDFYKRKRPSEVSLDEEMLPVAEPQEQLYRIGSEERKTIFKELLQLKERERLIIYYKFFEGCTNRKIAELLEMNESTVSTVLSRSLKKLSTDNMRELYFG